eukprot:3472382-Amphidinium_carterae.1
MCLRRGQVVAVLWACALSGATASFTPESNKALRVAVKQWLEEEAMAEAKYGHISWWNTSK